MGEQGESPVTDQAGGCLEAREEQDEGHRGGLLLSQVLALIRSADERGQQVVRRRIGGQGEPLLVDEVFEIAAYALDRTTDPAAWPAPIDHPVGPLMEDRLIFGRHA